MKTLGLPFLILTFVLLGSAFSFDAHSSEQKQAPVKLPLPPSGTTCRTASETIEIVPALAAGFDRVVLSFSNSVDASISLLNLNCKTTELDTYGGSPETDRGSVVMTCEPFKTSGALKNHYVVCFDAIPIGHPELSPHEPYCIITDGFLRRATLGNFVCN